MGVWNPHESRNIELIKWVQHRAPKCIKGLYLKSYSDRLKILGLDSLQTRRCMLDLTEVFKIVHSAVPTCHNLLNLDFSPQGHTFKLRKAQCKLGCRKHFFSPPRGWDSLPEEMINSTTLYAFRKKVLKFLGVDDVSYLKV